MTEEERRTEQATPIIESKISVTDIFGLGAATKNLTPAVTEIVKAIGAGAGKVYEPASIYLNELAKGAVDRRNAAADAKAYLQLETRSPVVLDAMRTRILGIEYQRQENIMGAQREAIRLAQASSSSHARGVHPDFMVDWLEGVKDVSDEMVRRFWAHLLAEAPSTEAGRVPKPVVDFLRLLDRELCEQLEAIYRASCATDGRLFDAMSDVPAMAAEIGMGSFGRSAHFETTEQTLKMLARSGDFPLFQLGARATSLCEIAFPVVDEDEALRNFYKSLPSVLLGMMSSGPRQMTIEVRDARHNRYLFDLQFHNSEVVLPQRNRNAAGVVRDIDLTGKCGAEELRAGLIEVAGWLQYLGSEKVPRLTL